MKFIRMTIDVRAIQWDGTEETFTLLNESAENTKNGAWFGLHPRNGQIATFHTNEGGATTHVQPGDWMYRLMGRAYVCTDKEFKVMFGD